ncbi:uncharacterized protein [Palaemon carinicauda]|uniref:uncharacterized protein n=1 Tax=Palaemon carinicauda TaxID=392227 RepID=UPI0035B67147
MDRGRKYKNKGLQFSSVEDSRALRAIDTRMGRKAQRDALISRRRMDGCEPTTAKSTEVGFKRNGKPGLANVSSDFPNKNIRELELQRYEQLLKWRDDRRKKLNVEKRCRKPSFKTGVFQPDQPKYLVSDDVKPQEGSATTPAKPPPFKYLQRSSTKYGFTPGASTKKAPRLCAGVTPTTSMPKVPKFNLRITPNQSLGRAAILRTRAVDQKENLHSSIIAAKTKTGDKAQIQRRGRSLRDMDVKRVLRNQSMRQQLASMNTEDLGVKTLPASLNTEDLGVKTLPASLNSEDLGVKTLPASLNSEDLGVKILPTTPGTMQPQRSRRSEVKALPATPVNIEPRKRRSQAAKFPATPNNSSDLEKSHNNDVELQQEAVEDTHSSESRSFAPGNFAFNFVATLKDEEPALENVTTASAEDKLDTPRRKISEGSISTPVSLVPDSVKEMNKKSKNGKMEKLHDDSLSGKELLKEKDISECKGYRISDAEESLEACVNKDVLMEETKQTFQEFPSDGIRSNVEMEYENEIVSGIAVEKCVGVIEQKNYIKEDVSINSGLKEDHVSMEYEKGNEGVEYNKEVSNVDDICNISVSKTPMSALRRSTRRSARISSCIDNTMTPTMSKLRPRTPCSRSTRRSMSAHTDFMVDQIVTPKVNKSSRRSTRRSLVNKMRSETRDSVVPLVFDDDASGDTDRKSQVLVPEVTESSTVLGEDVIEEETEVDSGLSAVDVKCGLPETPKIMQETPKVVQTPVAGNMITPCSSRRKGKVSWMIQESPYVNTERRSGKSKRSGVPADISSLFDDIPTDGSPLPSHLIPMVNECREALGQSPVLPNGEQLPIISNQGQSPALFNQRQSPLLPDAPITFSLAQDEDSPMSPEEQTCSNLLDLLKPSTPPSRNDTPDVDVWGEASPEDKDNNPFPLVSVDSVMPLPTFPAPSATRRSCRISLLPGLPESPANGKLTTVDQDLISWETPMMSAKKTKKIEKEKPRATPSRRSRRLSKACLE